MKKVIGILLVIIPFVISLANPDILSALSGILTVEKTSFELTGQVKEVVMGLRGNGYVTIKTDKTDTAESTEVRVPLSFANPTAVKIGSKVVVKGTQTTFLAPIYIEASEYKVQLRRNPIRDNLDYTTLSFKIKRIEVTKTTATIILADEKGKEVKIPAQIIPVWKNLKVGDDFKITGIKRSVNLPESIVIDGVSYKLSQQPNFTPLQTTQRAKVFGNMMMKKINRFRR
uniref:DUF5666 domain-containing protein n=1 Tax=Fervidobacterium nodosum TaxID=2424 RepID=A0A7C5U2W5_9BACT